jgi:hypothetical protein
MEDPSSASLDIPAEPEDVVLAGCAELLPFLRHFCSMLFASRRELLFVLLQATDDAPSAGLDVLAVLRNIVSTGPLPLRLSRITRRFPGPYDEGDDHH